MDKGYEEHGGRNIKYGFENLIYKKDLFMKTIILTRV